MKRRVLVMALLVCSGAAFATDADAVSLQQSYLRTKQVTKNLCEEAGSACRFYAVNNCFADSPSQRQVKCRSWVYLRRDGEKYTCVRRVVWRSKRNPGVGEPVCHPGWDHGPHKYPDGVVFPAP